MAQRCADRGVELTIVLPPMAANVRTEVCDAFGITAVMQDEVLPLLEKQNFAVLNYEWGTSCITDDDTQFLTGSTWTKNTACRTGQPNCLMICSADAAPPQKEVPCGTGLFDFVRTHRSGI